MKLLMNMDNVEKAEYISYYDLFNFAELNFQLEKARLASLQVVGPDVPQENILTRTLKSRKVRHKNFLSEVQGFRY